jgi:hypothetical protein
MLRLPLPLLLLLLLLLLPPPPLAGSELMRSVPLQERRRKQYVKEEWNATSSSKHLRITVTGIQWMAATQCLDGPTFC